MKLFHQAAELNIRVQQDADSKAPIQVSLDEGSFYTYLELEAEAYDHARAAFNWITDSTFGWLELTFPSYDALIDFLAVFQQQFVLQPAAGGVLFHPGGDVLMIYRRGTWDLPKGKIDAGEMTQDAALREVEEETGVRQLTIHRPLGTTYHVFHREPEQWILKPTYWFEMTTENPEQALTPQLEEDIEKVEWVPRNQLSEKLRDSFGSIRELLKLLAR